MDVKDPTVSLTKGREGMAGTHTEFQSPALSYSGTAMVRDNLLYCQKANRRFTSVFNTRLKACNGADIHTHHMDMLTTQTLNTVTELRGSAVTSPSTMGTSNVTTMASPFSPHKEGDFTQEKFAPPEGYQPMGVVRSISF